MTHEAPTQEQLNQIIHSVNVAEATNRAAVREIIDTRVRLKRTEASLALVLASLSGLQDERTDYVLHRLSLELRRFAEIPETAAELAGCAGDDVDPALLQAIASHLCGQASDSAWRAPQVQPMAMH